MEKDNKTQQYTATLHWWLQYRSLKVTQYIRLDQTLLISRYWHGTTIYKIESQKLFHIYIKNSVF